MNVVTRTLAIAAIALVVAVEAFRASLPSIISAIRPKVYINTGNRGGMPPLNTNPRKIDVGEESIARFGKVSTTCSEWRQFVVIWA